MSKERFRQIRMYHDMSQVEFSEFIGISYSLVAMIESGHKKISPKTLMRLANKVELTDDFFLFVEKLDKLSQ